MLFLIFAAGLYLIAFPNHNPVHPAALALFSGEKIDALECQQPTGDGLGTGTVGGADPGMGASLDAPAPSRTANFRILGSYECRRPIFSASERNPFISRLLAAEIPKAKRIAAAVQNRLKRDTSQAAGELSVHVNGLDSEPQLREEVAALYRNELTMILGPGRVARQSAPGSSLEIEVRKTDVPELMSQARWLTKAMREGGSEGETL